MIAHWDEVEWRRRAKGEMDAEWQRLGDAAGTVGVGVNRIRVAPRKLPTPPHSHGASHEIYYVLAGSGLAWQDDQVHEVRAGDCVEQEPNAMEHTFVGGDDGLELIVFGTRHPIEFGWLPRSRAIRLGWPWAEGRDDDPWDVEAHAEPLATGEPAPRPANIVNVDGLDGAREFGAVDKLLAGRDETALAGLHWNRLDPGLAGPPPHLHSEEEEVFVILEGDGTLELWPRPDAAAHGAPREDVPVRAGHVVARTPGPYFGHRFRGGERGMTMLVYGTRKPGDMTYYPRSNKISFRGLGVIGRVEPVDYFDGEPD